MNCDVVISTECCTNNCKPEEKPEEDEYEEGKTDEENLDTLSTETIIGSKLF